MMYAAVTPAVMRSIYLTYTSKKVEHTLLCYQNYFNLPFRVSLSLSLYSLCHSL
jgi:hypothetical protein